MDDDQKRRRFFDLMERYCQLGRLLPDHVDDEATALAEAQMVLDEMQTVQGEIDLMLGIGSH